MTVIDDIDLDLAVAGIEGRMRGASKARWRAVEMIREENLLAPLACYRRLRVREVRDGGLFLEQALVLHCPVLATVPTPLEGVTAVACTLGKALEKRVAALCAEEKLAAGLAFDELGNELLRYTAHLMVRKVGAQAPQVYSPDILFTPGARELSLDQQRAVLAMAAAERIGISATGQGALTPTKSKSFVMRIGKEMMPAMSDGA